MEDIIKSGMNIMIAYICVARFEILMLEINLGPTQNQTKKKKHNLAFLGLGFDNAVRIIP